MKTISKLFICLFTIIGFESFSQDFIGTNVRFTKEIETGGSFTSNEIGLIRLNNQNDEFTFEIPMFTILTNPKNNDSITNLNREVRLSLKAHFPVDDLDFLANDGTEKTFDIPADLTINNRTLPVTIHMGMHSTMAKVVDTRGIKTYPALISFIIEINPAEYLLDFETINFVRSINVEVRNGIINRSDQSPVGR
ncbi:MAG TPA: hypothetical protein VF868_08710 [Bacteroidia bacterium]|jgi:hypothetical protein